jgi:SAM-dependent methyltransferase
MNKVDFDYEGIWTEWDDMKTYGPASRHVRRLIINLLKGLHFNSVLDVGCGVGTLLNEIKQLYPAVELSGTEYSREGLEIARKRLPQIRTAQLDISKEKLDQTSDLVFCIDVLEHIEDDLAAMKNLHAMTNKYMLAVVPTGPLFEVERDRVGHVHGYSTEEFSEKLIQAGFKVIRDIQWGFPFYNIYRRILHRMPENSTIGEFGLFRKMVSLGIYLLMFLNLPVWGERYFVLCGVDE